MSNTNHLKPIRSFVKRQRGMTPNKEKLVLELLPKYGLSIANGIQDFVKIFHRTAPLTIEIGFGTGDTLIQMAINYPNEDFIGIEVHKPGISNILTQIQKNGLTNLRIFPNDAVEVFNQCIPDSSIDRVLIFFPDPWPKRRHHKRRLIQPSFVTLIKNKLKNAGILHIATDWENYATHSLEILQQFPDLINVAGDKLYSARPEYRPLTKFEKRGQKLGHAIYDLIFVKRI